MSEVGVAIRRASGYYYPMPVLGYQGVRPRLGERVYVAPNAFVAGDVEVGDDVSFWFGAAARGDVNSIRIGPRSNIQDGAILHVSYREHALEIGAEVIVGHAAVVHGCTIEDGALIGIGACVLDGAVVETGAQVGAGAVVAPGTRVAAGQLVLGVPARAVRALSAVERSANSEAAARYVALKESYAAATGYGVTAVERREGEGQDGE